MADDWQPGDLALCVNDTPHWSDQPSASGFEIRVGARYTVSRVGFCRFGLNALIGLFEDPSGWDWGYLAFRFIKVTPLEPDAEDAETIRLLTGAPVREGV